MLNVLLLNIVYYVVMEQTSQVCRRFGSGVCEAVHADISQFLSRGILGTVTNDRSRRSVRHHQTIADVGARTIIIDVYEKLVK